MTDLMDETPVAAAVVVARIPVLDSARAIVGFELVNRSTHGRGGSGQVAGSRAGSSRAEHGQAVVTVSSLLGTLDVNLAAVVGDKLLFCTVDRAVLLNETRLNLPPLRTVLEVPSCGVDEKLLASISAYKRAGFTIMVRHDDHVRAGDKVLGLADLVKVDLRSGAPGDIMDVVEGYKGASFDLVAAGCDTAPELDWAQAVGFDLFIGRGQNVPEAPSDSASAPLPVSQVQLGVELLSHDLDLDRIEDVLRGDPALVLQLLNLASSGAAGGLRRQVRSLREALVVMGTERIRQWAALVLLSRHSQRQTDALVTALVRARMCELLAPGRGADGHFAFTAGLLSALNIMLGVSVADVTQQINVAEDLTDAAFRREGTVGRLITRVEDHEQWIDTGSQLPADHDEVTFVGAMAFSWAARYAEAIDSAARD